MRGWPCDPFSAIFQDSKGHRLAAVFASRIRPSGEGGGGGNEPLDQSEESDLSDEEESDQACSEYSDEDDPEWILPADDASDASDDSSQSSASDEEGKDEGFEWSPFDLEALKLAQVPVSPDKLIVGPHFSSLDILA